MSASKQAINLPVGESRGDDRKAAGEKVDRESAEGMKASDPPSFNPIVIGAGAGHHSTDSAGGEPPDALPVAMNAIDRQERIRHKAHSIWLEEGQPGDRGREHWRMAEEAIDAEDAKGVKDEGHFA